MKYLALLLFLSAFLPQAAAFSPYEAYLATDRPTQVGLIAIIGEDQKAPLLDTIDSLSTESARTTLAEEGITNVRAFTRVITDTPYVVVHFIYDGTRPYLGAAEAFERATAKLEIDWRSLIKPHPRAVTYDRQWLQMEWINYIRGLDVDRAPTNALMIGCRVRPEKEAEYRTLHQTVWPGVVDQVERGKIRDLCVFLVELDDDLVEFLYLEYMGDDQAADDAANAADPINQRWWKQTDACQMPFADVEEGIWTLMESMQPTEEAQ